MTQRIMHIHAWDGLGRVFATATVRAYDGMSPTDGETTLDRSISVEGTGEDDDEQWARDALVALLEAL